VLDDSGGVVQQSIQSLYELVQNRTDLPLDVTYVLDALQPLMSHFSKGWTCALLGPNGIGQTPPSPHHLPSNVHHASL